MINKITLFGILCLPFMMCGNDGAGKKVLLEKPVLTTSFPLNGGQNIPTGEQTLILTFDQNITLESQHQIVLNEKSVSNASAASKELKISAILAESTGYTLTIPSGAVKGPTGVGADEIKIVFTTKGSEIVEIEKNLVSQNSTPEAQNVYDFLAENFGKKAISGTMANVSWNINEAEWVNKHTGKYPALNGFDYIHLHASPSIWIDYSNTEVVESWWENNGLVTVMWHWNVPVSEQSNDFAFYTEETSFNVSKAVQEGTYENMIIKADLEKVANHLLLLQEKNIPVIWRPLHEAEGGWFWWGAKGPDPCKSLWKLMFDMFEEKGLNNLIWAWTTETDDHEWYPGDQYVDIIGRDAYNRNASTMFSEYDWIRQTYPDKIIALSEFGSLSSISDQWGSGAKWSWFMSWYDYNRTNNISGSAFNETDHEHVNIDFWKQAFQMDEVITRDELPNLK